MGKTKFKFYAVIAVVLIAFAGFFGCKGEKVEPADLVLRNAFIYTVDASNPAIIRSYPHSLMESLAAGKPVIVSRQIPMADYVQRMGCGTVVDSVTPVDLLAAIK